MSEFMKSVGRSTFDDLVAAMERDIIEYNSLASESRHDHALKLDKDVELPGERVRLLVVHESQEHETPNLTVEYDRFSNGAKIACWFTRRSLTVKPLWDSDSNRTVYQIDEYRYEDISQVSQKILLPTMLHPNLDWGDALERMRE